MTPHGFPFTATTLITRMKHECEAARRRMEYSGKPGWVELMPGCDLPVVMRKGKRRWAAVEAAEEWLKERGVK